MSKRTPSTNADHQIEPEPHPRTPVRRGHHVEIGFFAPGEGGEPRLAELLETVGNGIDLVVPVSGFAGNLTEAGFTEVTVEPIGDRVWAGMDAWIAQTEYHDSWGRNWLTAYRSGWVDYYIVHANA